MTPSPSDVPPADVGVILAALREDVRARRLAQGRTEPSPLERDLQRSLDEIELARVVSAHWPLIGNTLPQKLINLVNKLVRRYLRWYINPIVEQQNAYNDAVARSLRLLADAYADLAETVQNDQPGAAGPAAPVESPPPQHETADAAAVQNLVRERAAQEPPARFPDLELRHLEPHLRLRQEVNAHWPLTGRTLLQRALALHNKLVRRYLRWYINPIVEQQNSANLAITTAILNLIRLDAEHRAQAAARRARNTP